MDHARVEIETAMTTDTNVGHRHGVAIFVSQVAIAGIF